MDKKEFLFPGTILVLVLIIATVLLVGQRREPAMPGINLDTTTASSTVGAASTSAQKPSPSGVQAYYPYGTVVLSVGQVAGFKDGLSMRPTAVTEDSRCPADVQCIQAGTVKVSLKVTASDSSVVRTLALGEKMTVGGDTITFESATPVRMKDASPAQNAYRLTFTVTRGGTATKPSCYVGGCSSQICSDSPDAVSNCLYSPSYACYKTATCERQTTGKCGWTETPALKACLANPPA